MEFQPTDEITKRAAKFTKSQQKAINDLLDFMKQISNKFDNKNVLKLEKLEEFLKLKKYINE